MPTKELDQLKNLVEMVRELVRDYRCEIKITDRGYSEETVKALAAHYDTNYTSAKRYQELNPFTIIYIDEEGEVQPHHIDCKAKIFIHAKRPITNHQ